MECDLERGGCVTWLTQGYLTLIVVKSELASIVLRRLIL